MITDFNKVSAIWMFGGTSIFMLGEYFSLFTYLGLGITSLALIGFIIPEELSNKFAQQKENEIKN